MSKHDIIAEGSSELDTHGIKGELLEINPEELEALFSASIDRGLEEAAQKGFTTGRDRERKKEIGESANRLAQAINYVTRHKPEWLDEKKAEEWIHDINVKVREAMSSNPSDFSFRSCTSQAMLIYWEAFWFEFAKKHGLKQEENFKYLYDSPVYGTSRWGVAIEFTDKTLKKDPKAISDLLSDEDFLLRDIRFYSSQEKPPIENTHGDQIIEGLKKNKNLKSITLVLNNPGFIEKVGPVLKQTDMEALGIDCQQSSAWVEILKYLKDTKIKTITLYSPSSFSNQEVYKLLKGTLVNKISIVGSRDKGYLEKDVDQFWKDKGIEVRVY